MTSQRAASSTARSNSNTNSIFCISLLFWLSGLFGASGASELAVASGLSGASELAVASGLSGASAANRALCSRPRLGRSFRCLTKNTEKPSGIISF